MEQIINLIIYCFIYIFIHLVLYRLLNININKILTVIFIFLISLFFGLKANSNEIILTLINFNLFVICFYILIPGILNNGPALLIIDLLMRENKKSTKEKIKYLFKNKTVSTVVKNRLKINIDSGLIIRKKSQLFLSKKGKIIINFFNLIVKIFKLKIYE